MPDTCATPARKPYLVNVIAARDQIVNHLEDSPRAQQLLMQRLSSYSCVAAAWAQTVQDILPSIPTALRNDVADAARQAWNNRVPRKIKRVRRRGYQ